MAKFLNVLSKLILFASVTSAQASPPCDTVKPFDIEFWKLQNMLRTDPKAFVPYLYDMKTRFVGNNYKNARDQTYYTLEGAEGVQILIDFLEEQTPLTALQWSPPLAVASSKYAAAQGPSGATGHTGPDGSTMRQRIEAEIPLEIMIGENIMYGSQSPLEALISLCIDDGIPNRGHRANIFQTQFYQTGVGTDMHSVYSSQTVTTFMGSNTPDTTYIAPSISVPTTVMGYTGYSSWDVPAGLENCFPS